MSLAKRSASPLSGDEGGFDSKRMRDGFIQVTTQQMAAQVALARANTDQLLRDMRLKKEGGIGGMADKPESSRMAEEVRQNLEVPVSKKLVQHLMTPENRVLLAEESGADVEWSQQEARVKLVGSAKTLSTAKRSLARVEMHCHWGASPEKVKRLLRRQQGVETVLCRLSPMTVNKLLPAEKMFNSKETSLRIGKDKQNDVIIQDTQVSRHHCLISFDANKGVVYIADLSTNGTFLNGTRLPSKKLGKVLLSHGDEILFRDPGSGDTEFGYICNLKEVSVRPEVKFQAPMRLLTAEEQSLGSRGL